MTRQMVVITGAGGFVCSQIAVELAGAGYEVIGLDRVFDDEAATRLRGVHQVTGALEETLRDLGEIRPFAVVHGAAVTASPEYLGMSAARHVRTNMDMLTGCLDWSRRSGAQRFIFLSSSGVFSPHDGTAAVSETSPATAHGPYAAAKRAGEIVTKGAADGAFATLSVRLSNLFGAYEASRPSRPGLSLVARMMAAAKTEGVIEVDNPKARRDWTWLPDIGRALSDLLASPPGDEIGVLHCGSGEVLTDLGLAELIARDIPGTRIAVSQSPASEAKPPMTSSVTSCLNRFRWTPVRQALSGLLRSEVLA